MRTLFRHLFPAVLCTVIFSGCAAVRTEFYREETKFLYETGCQSYKQGDYADANRFFQQVIDLDPQYGPAHAGLGNLAMIDEDYQQAFVFYKQAITCDPELEDDLLPLLLSSDTHRQREPLVKAGVSLVDIYRLFMAEDIVRAESMLGRNLPLELLAADAVSITPGQLGELRHRSAELARHHPLPSRVKLLVAYILFHAETEHQLIIELLSSLAQDDDDQQNRREAYILLGRAMEHIGRKNSAVDAYLAAVEEGASLSAVAHYLARLYRVDIASVIPNPPLQVRAVPPEPDTIELIPIAPVSIPDLRSPAQVGHIGGLPVVTQEKQENDPE
ncbi:MAG: tetratricopeptide repeat protein [Desulfobulbaceae bacterium]|nr:tetratricopeptide repeat protein [Desulfobulbaceae bacterium]